VGLNPTAVGASHRQRPDGGIIPVDRFASDEVAALYTELESEQPGRFVVGLGGAHGPDPLTTLNTYLDRARKIARGPLGFFAQVPAYQASFKRMGFDAEDVATLADPLVDALVVWGGSDTIRNRQHELQQAGADHVAISIVSASPAPTFEEWREVADVLVGGRTPP